MPKALIIPADPTEPVRVIEVGEGIGPSILEAIGGGFPTTARYDRDAMLFVDDQGFMKGLPINPRATAWMREHSEVAQAGRMRSAPPDYVLVGPAVMMGIDDGGELRDVPQRVLEHFGVAVERTAEPPGAER